MTWMKISLYRCQVETSISLYRCQVCAFKIIHTTCQISVGDKGMSRTQRRSQFLCRLQPRHVCGPWPGTALSEISKAEGYWCGEGVFLFLLLCSGCSCWPVYYFFWATVAFPENCAWLFNLSPQRRATLATSQFPFGSAAFDSCYGLHVSTGAI